MLKGVKSNYHYIFSIFYTIKLTSREPEINNS